jgi:protein SCO1/2
MGTKHRRLVWLWPLTLVVVACGLGLGLQHHSASVPASSVAGLGLGGPFTLTAADGSRFTQANLAGKPYALYFGFLRCPDACPTTLARLSRLRKAMGPAGNRLAIVFVSVDPGHDHPAEVGRYANLFGTPMIGLTGSEAQLAPMEKAWGVYVQKVPQPGGDYTIDHSTIVYLMGADGHLIDIIDHDEGDGAALAKLRALVD